MPKRPADTSTLDMFADQPALYPVRRPPEPRAELAGFDSRLCRAMSQALKEHPESREIVAARMAEILGQPGFSKHMLDKYTAESCETHAIGVSRLLALVIVTRATWLLDLLAEQAGCVVMEREEARLAERGFVDQQIELLRQRKREMSKMPPVLIAGRRRGVR